MHGPVRDRLERLLTETSSLGESKEVEKHLSSCAECSAELEAMKTQSKLFSSLRTEETEPMAGFYARVMQRIEERANTSVWTAFIYSSFGVRLAYASLAIALVLGTYWITEESQDGHLGGSTFVAHKSTDITPVIGDRQEQRDAVLVNFASFSQGTAQ